MNAALCSTKKPHFRFAFRKVRKNQALIPDIFGFTIDECIRIVLRRNHNNFFQYISGQYTIIFQAASKLVTLAK